MVQSQQQVRITRNIYYNLTFVWLTEMEQSTDVVQIKGSVLDPVGAPEFDKKHLKKA